jgi:Cu(I)/Ag(I) efflux system membrane protein CusA/SilA
LSITNKHIIIIVTGIDSDAMSKIAATMAGGIFTSMIMELTVYPAIFYIWKKREIIRTNKPVTNEP